jgi:hypothetical protein
MMAGAGSTVPGAFTALLRNDARSLLPFWIAGVGAATFAGFTARVGIEGVRRLVFADPHALSLVASIALIVALGAQSLGHEYSHRTLGLLLALPASRRQMYLAKHAVVAAMVLPLVAYLWLLDAFLEFRALLWLTAAAALCLSPLCTMIGRSALAGAALTTTLPATVFILVTIVSGPFDRSAEAERAARDLWAWIMVPLLGGSAVLGWHWFMRLEAIESEAAASSSRSRSQPAAGVRQPRHPLWLLVCKELRLQRMVFGMVTFYAALTTIATMVQMWRADVPVDDDILSVASACYWLGLPVLAGSLAIAEERHLGTLRWQLQLPMPAWHQWMVKAATVFAVAPVLAVGAPLLAMQFWPAVRPNLELTVVLTLITTAASLYISSLCSSGMRATVASLIAIPSSLWLVGVAVTALGRIDFLFWRGHGAGWLTLALTVVGLLLGLSLANHRPELPEPARVRIQLLAIAALIGTGVLLVTAAA